MRACPHLAPQHREIVHHIHAQHGHGLHRARHVDQLSPIAVGIVNELRDDVVVRDEMPAAGDEKPGADRGLGGGPGLDNLDLDDAVGVPAEDLGGGEASLLREEVADPKHRGGKSEGANERHQGRSGARVGGKSKV